jgi:acetyl-CoA acetyltransferase family protein
MAELEEVVIVDFLRTAMSRSRLKDPERDVFNNYRADDLLGLVLKELVKRQKFDAKEIDEIITGTAYPVFENWLYGGRNPVFLANLPETIPAMAIDRQCASSMASVHVASMEIMTGNSNIAIAGGFEHMTHIPMINEHIKLNKKLQDPTTKKSGPDYAHYDLDTGFSMIQTAQKLWEQNPQITRKQMDEWSLGSHVKAAKARDDGFFDGEILPVEGNNPDGSNVLIKYDQSIRDGAKLEDMEKLPIVSKKITKDPQITAGNSSPLNAGAGACVLMSRKKANELGIKPLAKIKAISWAAVSPGVMGKGPVPASRKALAKAGLKADDIDFWEINEAFAIVPLYAMQELKIDPARVNVKGGGIALGHALGLTGVRLVCTLARILQQTGKKYGLATPCVGGGQGTATIVERV